MLLHCLQPLGEPKVSEKNVVLVGEEYVLRLDVPVDHPLLVHVVHSTTHLEEDSSSFVLGKLA